MSEKLTTVPRSSHWRTYLDVLSTIAIVAASMGLMWRVFSPAQAVSTPTMSVPKSPISIIGAYGTLHS